MVLEALLAASLAVVIAGVLYIVVTKFYSKVEAASATKRKKIKKYYYKATVWNGQVVVSPKGISKSKAISRVKSNLYNTIDYPAQYANVIGVGRGSQIEYKEIDVKFRTNKILLIGNGINVYNGNSYLAPMQMVREQRKGNIYGKN